MDVRLLPGNNAQQRNWSDPNPLRNRLGHSANCTPWSDARRSRPTIGEKIIERLSVVVARDKAGFQFID
jgi:hypothetical protein